MHFVEPLFDFLCFICRISKKNQLTQAELRLVQFLSAGLCSLQEIVNSNAVGLLFQDFCYRSPLPLKVILPKVTKLSVKLLHLQL